MYRAALRGASQHCIPSLFLAIEVLTRITLRFFSIGVMRATRMRAYGMDFGHCRFRRKGTNGKECQYKFRWCLHVQLHNIPLISLRVYESEKAEIM